MNNQKYTIQYCWQRLKHQLGRIFAALKFLVVTGFVALMLVITNYTELKEIVLSVLDESTVAFIKNVVNVLYGSSSVFFALEQTVCLVAVPAMAILLRSICTFSFVNYVILLITCGVVNKLCYNAKVVRPAQPQCEVHSQVSNKWLTLCKFIS